MSYFQQKTGGKNRYVLDPYKHLPKSPPNSQQKNLEENLTS